MTIEEKKIVLNNISRLDATDLYEYIKSGDISFDEMRATGKLSYEKQETIRTFLKEEEEKFAAEKEAWNQAVTSNDIIGYNAYLNKYPMGLYSTLAKNNLEKVKLIHESKKQELINELKQNPDFCTPELLQKLIGNGEISENDLYENQVITKDAFNLYNNPPTFLSQQNQSWGDLKPLPSGRTDVYFFGIPTSGKSCILAGLFYKADQLGVLSDDITNEMGTKYKNELIRAIEIGYVPVRTTNVDINYISCSLIENQREHPLSIIEMSGEFFNKTYERSNTTDRESIGAKGYLHNNNRKIIFFVVDYFKHNLGSIHQDEKGTQKDILNYVLKKLESDGTLEKTDSIQVIVSKSDLMPVGVDRNSCTKDFLNKYYLSFINELKRLNKKYNINPTRSNNVVVHPFSLGTFMLGKTFIYNDYDSTQLLQSLLNLSAHKRTRYFWDKLFNK